MSQNDRGLLLEPGEPNDPLSDEALRQALAQAPDRTDLPDWRVRQAILDHAHDAISASEELLAASRERAPWWRLAWWRHKVGVSGATPWNAALASLMVAVLVTLLWQREPVPGARPDDAPAAPAPATKEERKPQDEAAKPMAEATLPEPAAAAPAAPAAGATLPQAGSTPAAAPAATPAPTPPAVAPVPAGPSAPPTPASPATAASPATPYAAAREAEAAKFERELRGRVGAPASSPIESFATGQQPAPRADMSAPGSSTAEASADRRKSAPASASAPASPPASAPAPATTAPSSAAPDANRQAAAGSPRQAAPAAPATATAPAPRNEPAPMPDFSSLSRWTELRVANVNGWVRVVPRAEAGDLGLLMSSAAIMAVGAPPLRSLPEWRVSLERRGQVLAVLEVGRHDVRWTEGALPPATGTPSPEAQDALRQALNQAIKSGAPARAITAPPAAARAPGAASPAGGETGAPRAPSPSPSPPRPPQ